MIIIKIYHFSLVFIILMVMVISTTEAEFTQQHKIMEEKQLISRAVDAASIAAASCLKKVKSADKFDKNEVVDAFFDSLSASLGIIDNVVDRQNLELYVPLIVITEEDGFSIYYHEVTEKDNERLLVGKWSEKIYFSYWDNISSKGKRATNFVYKFLNNQTALCCDTEGILGEKGRTFLVNTDNIAEDEDFYYIGDLTLEKGRNYDALIFKYERFEEKRRSVVNSLLNTYISYYLNRFNRTASYLGISYKTVFPEGYSGIYMREVMEPSVFVFFQGYPIAGTTEAFNYYAAANTQIVSREVYFIDENKLYHADGCSRSGTPVCYYMSREECALNGAFPCECCK